MSATPPVSFGDNVRVRDDPATRSAGLAGLMGQVYGETTPSVTSVDVIGELASDHAINVHFEERGASYWIAPQLLEFVDHAPGTEIKLDGVAKRWVRRPDGEWDEEDLDERPRVRKRWWKFW